MEVKAREGLVIWVAIDLLFTTLELRTEKKRQCIAWFLWRKNWFIASSETLELGFLIFGVLLKLFQKQQFHKEWRKSEFCIILLI